MQIESQGHDLNNYSRYLSKLHLGNLEPKDALFCGAGDSLACAIFIERLMNFEPRAFDPYDVVLYPEVLRTRKKAYFISVSGRTRSNILAAKLAKRKGLVTTAITANPDSELAKSCSETIELHFSKSDELTPGTNSFTASLLAVSSLFKMPPKINAGKIIENSKKWAKLNADGKGNYHFVGSGSFYGIAMYGSAKILELLGSQSCYQLTEEFAHMNLFSLNPDDRVFILGFGTDDQRAKELDSSLSLAGFKSILLPVISKKEHVVHRAISYSIHLQYLALELAQSRGLDRPSFLGNLDVLKASDRMIY